MKGKNHLLVGITTGVALSEHFNINPLITVGLSALGSVIVDIDEESSTINKVLFKNIADFANRLLKLNNTYKVTTNHVKTFLGIVSLVVPNILTRYLGVLILLSMVSAKVRYKISLFRGIEKRQYHRTFFHDPLIGTMLFITPLYILNVPNEYKVPYVVGLLIGHYLMDMFTHYGLPVYAFRIRHLRIPLIHFDSRNWIAETIVVVSYIGLMVLVKYPNLINTIKV